MMQQSTNNSNLNRSLLQGLFESQGINLLPGRLFDQDCTPKPSAFDFDKVEGMMLGIAIGDSLGKSTEGALPSRRRMRHGEIRDYLPSRYRNDARGYPTDDTQLAFWTLEQLIADKGFVPGNVAGKFTKSGRIYGIGSTVRRFLTNYNHGMPWHRSGPESAGNGALMRIAPILIPHLRRGGRNLWVDTALCAMMTHNDFASTSACLAFVAMLWDLLDMPSPPDRRWWLERYVELTKDLEGDQHYAPRGGQDPDYRGSLCRFVEEKIPRADAEGMTVSEACDSWYSGAYMLETVPCVLYILMRHGQDSEEAIVRAVNDTKDNDTIAAIVGACVGALHGKKNFPLRWIENLSGRTRENDDGRIFELLDEAREVFWSPAIELNEAGTSLLSG